MPSLRIVSQVKQHDWDSDIAPLEYQHYMGVNMDVRCLRYRLKRQGMLELDAWLSNLDDALLSEDATLIAAVQMLLACEAPVLLAMMHGDEAFPDALKLYLKKPSSCAYW